MVEIVNKVQYNSSFQIPYDHEDSRLSLYEILEAICLSNILKLNTPVAICVNLFRNALNDPSHEVLLSFDFFVFMV